MNNLSLFESCYLKTASEPIQPFIGNDSLLDRFLSTYGRTTYDFGLYRIHSIASSSVWNHIVGECFPQHKGKIKCFGFDWYGRQYAQAIDDEDLLFMFDGATFEWFQLKANIIAFHNELLTETKFDTLLVDEFESWKVKHPIPLRFNQCVGFKIPLFLGGEENSENLEMQEMQVYWEINHKLYFH